MRLKRPAFVLAATLGLVASSPALADQVDIDLSGWVVSAGFSDAGNSNTTIDIGANSMVTGADWINLQFTPQGASWQSDLVLSLNDSAISAWWDSTVSDVNAGGTYSGSGSFPGPAEDGGPFAVLADGELYVEAYDVFDDEPGAPDALITSGTLRVYYTQVPEPASLGLLGLGTLFLLRRRNSA
jgi:hypothetical protein